MGETDLRVIVKAKELAVHSFRLTSNNNRFPKKYRHSLCDEIQKTSAHIYRELLKANRINNISSKRERCETITEAIGLCDYMLFLIELSMILGLMNDKSTEYWSRLVQDVKYMSIAWRTRERK